jgi:hypothetical protein
MRDGSPQRLDGQNQRRGEGDDENRAQQLAQG